MYNSYTSYVAQKAEKIQESVIQKILANSSITQEQADEFVENYITFSEETSEVLHKNGQSIEELKKDIAEFYRLTNGNLPPTTVYAENKKGRSFQEGLSITLLKKWNNAKFYSKWTLFHELGHVIEEDKRLTIITSAFVKKRATSNKLFSLKELTGLNYKSSERTYLDHFADHYVGKPYEGGNSEVLSMGIQTLADKDSFAKGLKDYSHMAMVFGIMQKKWHSIPNKYLEYKKKNEFPFLDKLIKKEKWEKAIDKAITQDFKEKLAMPLGVDGIHVEHSYNKYNIKELRLIYNSGKKSKTVTYSDPVGFRDAYRIAYLIIAYKRGLLPYNKEKYNINSPDYFFVNYEIFFESPLGFCSTDKLPEIR